ncbi:hypothetical protein J6590_060769 [Homalodisca vitripennis]|nr:hypothetical protein J6590_060769 [Homalodisca vitripennis]
METVSFCLPKCTLIRGHYLYRHETRDRDNYRSERHRTLVYEHLPLQAVVSAQSLSTQSGSRSLRRGRKDQEFNCVGSISTMCNVDVSILVV